MMDRRFDSDPFVHEQHDHPATTPENAANSPLSGGDDTAVTTAPSPNKRRGLQKRVVSVRMGGEDGSWSKGEVYPPSDSWTWRKYGQKPIKGSPYPRGYYRCSSSKGCPARKQVERSRVDPTMVVITYARDHNHPFPTVTAATKHPNPAVPAIFLPEELAVFAIQRDLEPDNYDFAQFTGGYGWFSDVESTVLEIPLIPRPTCADDDVSVMFTMGEEDESLFADLGELPECSSVFRRTDEHLRRCSVGTLRCGST